MCIIINWMNEISQKVLDKNVFVPLKTLNLNFKIFFNPILNFEDSNSTIYILLKNKNLPFVLNIEPLLKVTTFPTLNFTIYDKKRISYY